VKLGGKRLKEFLRIRYKMNDKEFPKVGIAFKVVDSLFKN
jgi:hypothetical protein